MASRVDIVNRLIRSAAGKLKEVDTRVEAAHTIKSLRQGMSFLTSALVESAADTASIATLLKDAADHPLPAPLLARINKELVRLKLVPENNKPPHVQLVPDATRFCQSCRMKRDIDKGRWSVASNGHTRRWICGHCLESRAQRMAQGAQP